MATVAGFSAGQMEDERQTAKIDFEVDLRREAAARAAECLIVLPPFCARCQTWARTTVESNMRTRCALSLIASALTAAGGSEPEEKPDSRSHRACVWGSANITGRPDRADDRHRPSASEDRIAKPRVQHPPPRNAGADGCCMRAKSACAARNGAPDDSAQPRRCRIIYHLTANPRGVTIAWQKYHCSRCPQELLRTALS